ncbi:MAG: diacylglycerol/lipid kinase family protein [Anaerolineales bacterium]
MAFQHVRLIVNPAAGTANTILNTTSAVFNSYDMKWSVDVTHQDGDGARLAAEAIDDGADLIVAYGGDGTIKDVANGLLEHDVPLAILPGGTGNALSYKLNIPQDLRAALELIVSDYAERAVDLGQVTCGDEAETQGYFLLRTNIGVQNDILEKASRDLKNRFGNLAYIFAAVESLTGTDTMAYHLCIDEEEDKTLEGVACMIANAVTIGGGAAFDFAPDVRVDDGVLDAFVFEPQSSQIMAVIKSHLDADLGQFPGHYTGRRFVVKTDDPQPISIDGENLGHTPATIDVISDAMRVLVPKE